ncbi:transposase [Enterobacter ludwigii]
MLNQWDALCYYRDDSLAEPDNNVAKWALQAMCLSKKKYIFFGCDHVGERGIPPYRLIEICLLNSTVLEAYLRHILRSA